MDRQVSKCVQQCEMKHLHIIIITKTKCTFNLEARVISYSNVHFVIVLCKC